MELIKYIIGIPLFSTLIISIIGPLAKKYAQFQRWDFFSRSSSEQIKAVKWIKETTASTPDLLARVEQQLRLQSFGLHRDFYFSFKIICFQSVHPQSLIPFLKTVLRYQGLYRLADGNIYPRRNNGWFITMLSVFLFFFTGSEIYRGYVQHNIIKFWMSLSLFIFAFMACFWMAFRVWEIYYISKKLNTYVPPSNEFKSKSDDFCTILNNTYP